jgi:formylglycine-generating enzyme required for sulfatase activity
MASPQKIMTIPDTGITLVKLNGGTFLMGDDHGAGSAKPAHRVVLSPFFIGTHEISGKQYARIVGNAPSGQTDLELPANNVSWHDADRFCRLLTLRKKKAGRLPDDMQYRLPTEAEWEYACRAGSKSKYFFGDMFEELPEYVVCGNGKILKPGTKKPNKFGLYDMLGNVWEWCYDANGKYSALLGIDPAVAGKSHEDRIIRGGSADSRTDEFASSYRRAISPHGHTPLIGFRIVLGKKLNK